MTPDFNFLDSPDEEHVLLHPEVLSNINIVVHHKRSKNKTRLADRIENSKQRLVEDAKYKQMSAITFNDVWYRRNRSRVYFYLIPEIRTCVTITSGMLLDAWIMIFLKDVLVQ